YKESFIKPLLIVCHFEQSKEFLYKTTILDSLFRCILLKEHLLQRFIYKKRGLFAQAPLRL
ncbi:MAG: hypothetical protein IJR46_06415, partial [Neisseriaceae bacterium]|nr:hypothetical protein [Neisseriaceae bacterium]